MCNVDVLDDDLQALDLMHKEGTPLSSPMLHSLFQGCMAKKDLATVRHVHSLMVSNEYDSLGILADNLIRLFTLCGSLVEASLVFCRVSKPTVHTFHAVISAYATHDDINKALELCNRMQQEGTKPNKCIFLCILKICSSIGARGHGRLIHDHVIRSGLESNVMIGNTLINMYTKCGDLETAREVFDDLPHRTVVSWSAMMEGYMKLGHGLPALMLFQKMQSEGIIPDVVMFSCILKACGSEGALRHGRLINDQIIRSGIEVDVVVWNTLIDMYAKCGTLKEARKVFDGMPTRNTLSWGVMIAGYAQHNYGDPALKLLEKMLSESIQPDKVIYLCALKACASIGALNHGKHIHNQIISSGYDSDVVMSNALINMYAECGRVEEGHTIFNNLPKQDVMSWAVIIAGYAQHGHGLSALLLFQQMQKQGINADIAIFSSILKACESIGALQEAKLIHSQIICRGLESNMGISNGIIDMYVKFGSMNEAHKIFDQLLKRDVVSWGAMISGYAQHGHGFSALQLFEKMQQDRIEPDIIHYSCALKACGSIGALMQGKLIHQQLISSGLFIDAVIENSLIDMYAKCGSLEEAHRVFLKLGDQEVMAWGAMIGGCVLHGHNQFALELFESMQQEGVKPNKFIFSSLLKACGMTGAIQQGKLVHDQLLISGLESDVVVGSTLIDMYAKCGNMDEAFEVFEKLPNRNVVSWGAMIAGYATCGDSQLAVQFFEDMKQQGLAPDETIYASVLSACSHAGQVDKGYYYYMSMREYHGITPRIKHLNCIIDILGRAGGLKESEQLLQTIPSSPDICGWTSLLNACRMHGDADLGTKCFDELFWLDPSNASGFVMLSNIYAEGCMWDKLQTLKELRKYAGSSRKPGKSWIEVNGRVQEFTVGDETHPQSSEIFAS